MKEPLRLLVFTDLDGTLLDHDTYSWEAASPAMDLCKELHIPIVIVSSKTKAEIDPLRRRMGLSDPFVSENGGGIFFPKDSLSGSPPAEARDEGDLWRWSLGVPYPRLTAALREIRQELGWEIRGFSDINIAEIARLTGLGPEDAMAAAEREYDEPFLVLGPEGFDLSRLEGAAAQRGLSMTSGGRFFHLTGGCDKGEAVAKLKEWYRRVSGRRTKAVALGDARNDLPMLRMADLPVLVRPRKGGLPEEEIKGLWITDEPGPKGWNRAVLEIIARVRDFSK